MSVDREELRQRVEALRRELPEGAPVVPIATIRARDRAEVRTGVVFDLGLASPLYAQAGRGDQLHGALRVQPFRGLLTLEALGKFGPLARTSSTSRTRGGVPLEVVSPPVVIACDEVDEAALAATLDAPPMFPTLRAVITPTGGFRSLDAVSRVLGAPVGRLAPEVVLGELAPHVEWLVTPHAAVLLRDDADGSAPLGLLFLGGDDLAHARERARLARELLRG